MDQNKVDQFIMMNGKYLPQEQLLSIKSSLEMMDDSKWTSIQFMQFKDPMISLILSLFVGSLGVDRFYIGDTMLGVLKLITCGGFGLWTIIDLFLIMEATRQNNVVQFRYL